MKKFVFCEKYTRNVKTAQNRDFGLLKKSHTFCLKLSKKKVFMVVSHSVETAWLSRFYLLSQSRKYFQSIRVEDSLIFNISCLPWYLTDFLEVDRLHWMKQGAPVILEWTCQNMLSVRLKYFLIFDISWLNYYLPLIFGMQIDSRRKFLSLPDELIFKFLFLVL